MSRKLCALLVVVVSGLCFAAAALGLPPFTLGPKTARGGTGQAELFGLAVACHLTFDRVTVKVRLGTPGYDAGFVSRIVADPSGKPVALLGHARLQLVLRSARGHTLGGRALLPARVVPSSACTNLREVKVVGDFEGIVSLGVGLQQRRAFRVWRQASPRRLVIDVAH